MSDHPNSQDLLMSVRVGGPPALGEWQVASPITERRGGAWMANSSIGPWDGMMPDGPGPLLIGAAGQEGGELGVVLVGGVIAGARIVADAVEAGDVQWPDAVQRGGEPIDVRLPLVEGAVAVRSYVDDDGSWSVERIHADHDIVRWVSVLKDMIVGADESNVVRGVMLRGVPNGVPESPVSITLPTGLKLGGGCSERGSLLVADLQNDSFVESFPNDEWVDVHEVDLDPGGITGAQSGADPQINAFLESLPAEMQAEARRDIEAAMQRGDFDHGDDELVAQAADDDEFEDEFRSLDGSVHMVSHASDYFTLSLALSIVAERGELPPIPDDAVEPGGESQRLTADVRNASARWAHGEKLESGGGLFEEGWEPSGDIEVHIAFGPAAAAEQVIRWDDRTLAGITGNQLAWLRVRGLYIDSGSGMGMPGMGGIAEIQRQMAQMLQSHDGTPPRTVLGIAGADAHARIFQPSMPEAVAITYMDPVTDEHWADVQVHAGHQMFPGEPSMMVEMVEHVASALKSGNPDEGVNVTFGAAGSTTSGPQPRSGSVIVDGDERPAKIHEADGVWGAELKLDDGGVCTVMCIGKSREEIELVTLTTLRPALDAGIAAHTSSPMVDGTLAEGADTATGMVMSAYDRAAADPASVIADLDPAIVTRWGGAPTAAMVLQLLARAGGMSHGANGTPDPETGEVIATIQVSGRQQIGPPGPPLPPGTDYYHDMPPGIDQGGPAPGDRVFENVGYAYTGSVSDDLRGVEQGWAQSGPGRGEATLTVRGRDIDGQWRIVSDLIADLDEAYGPWHDLLRPVRRGS